MLASWIAADRSEEVERRTTEDGKKRTERTVDRCGLATRREPEEVVDVGVMRIDPSSYPVARADPSGDISNAVIFWQRAEGGSHEKSGQPTATARMSLGGEKNNAADTERTRKNAF